MTTRPENTFSNKNYLGQVFYPAGLAVPYPRRGLDLPLWQISGGFLLLAGITAAALVWRRKRPYLLVGWLWYLGMLLPVIGLIQFGVQATADRFTYLPQIGLYIILAWGAVQAIASWPYRRWMCVAGSVLVPAVLMACAWRQTTFWCDSETLWIHAVECDSRNAMAHNLLGDALFGRKRLDEALTHCRKAVEIDPNYAMAHYHLGTVLQGLGRINEAIAEYQKALRFDPNVAEAHNGLGNILQDFGRLDEAAIEYRKALVIDPDYVDAHDNLVIALSRQGKIPEALAERREMIRFRPNDVTLLNDTAWLLATSPNVSIRNGAEAVELAERAAKISGGQEPAVLGTLAAAYAEVGRFSEAVAAARRAVELAVSKGQRSLADEIRSRLNLYQAHKPYRVSTPAP